MEGEEEREASKYQKNQLNQLKRENGNMVSLSMLFHLMSGRCLCLQNTGHLLVYGLGYHAGSHGRHIAKVADSATICASYSHVINRIAKVIMQCLPLN